MMYYFCGGNVLSLKEGNRAGGGEIPSFAAISDSGQEMQKCLWIRTEPSQVKEKEKSA